MADSGRVMGERVFCYQCDNEWEREHGGLICPRCESEFTEILTPETEPDFGPDRIPSPPSLPNLRPLLDHNPWAENFDPDPHNNFTTFEFTSGNGGGRVSFSTRTFMTGGSLGMNNQAVPPMFGNLHPQGGLHMAGEPRNPHANNPTGNLQDMLAMLLQTMTAASDRIAMEATANQRGNPQAHNPPMGPFDFLEHLVTPGQHGDIVFGEQAFDRVMEQLMEQDLGNGAPPPASEEAIRSLGKKKVDSEMLGAEGRAECSICMDNVELGDESTTLALTVENLYQVLIKDRKRALPGGGERAEQDHQYQAQLASVPKLADTIPS
ncbi:hypothetical protein H2204_007883 [Knufia peltigerae]|uniref:RING-type domain-containing protein n=1 Tax=Knufia peltigerae TaxID=1002370 RepID=A0AA39CWL8_9EURO|nr:hypothetical protein H2204_007883 [Knufia peltigerae]